MLGVDVADAEVARIFTALGMQVAGTPDGWQVTAPTSRFDIEREEDLIEEVARIFGYDNIPTHSPAGALALAAEPEGRIGELALREQLAARDYYEAVNLSFVAPELLQRWGFDDRAGTVGQSAVGGIGGDAPFAAARAGRGAAP